MWDGHGLGLMLEASLSTGVTLRYSAQGDPAGVPVVLLHGPI